MKESCSQVVRDVLFGTRTAACHFFFSDSTTLQTRFFGAFCSVARCWFRCLLSGVSVLPCTNRGGDGEVGKNEMLSMSLFRHLRFYRDVAFVICLPELLRCLITCVPLSIP